MAQDNKSRMTLKFDVAAHSLELRTYGKTLVAITDLLQEINREFNNATKETRILNVQIEAEQPGSVEAIVGIALSNAHSLSLISLDHINFSVPGILKVLGDVLKLSKLLKGTSPAKTISATNGVAVENNSGSVVVINAEALNFYTRNPELSALAASVFKPLGESSQVKGFELKQKKKRLFSVKAKELTQIPDSLAVRPSKRHTMVDSTASLIARAVSFEPDLPYKFVYKGENISCLIKDDAFFQRVNDGEAFSKGDRFTCQLEIHQEWEAGLLTYVNKSYVIRKILSHQPRPRQQRLKLE